MRTLSDVSSLRIRHAYFSCVRSGHAIGTISVAYRTQVIDGVEHVIYAVAFCHEADVITETNYQNVPSMSVIKLDTFNKDRAAQITLDRLLCTRRNSAAQIRSIPTNGEWRLSDLIRSDIQNNGMSINVNGVVITNRVEMYDSPMTLWASFMPTALSSIRSVPVRPPRKITNIQLSYISGIVTE